MGHSFNSDKPRKIDNLEEYVKNRTARNEAGWINGRFLYKGEWYSEEVFNAMFPTVLTYSVIQLDGNQIKSN